MLLATVSLSRRERDKHQVLNEIQRCVSYIYYHRYFLLV